MGRVLLPKKIIYSDGNRYLELRAPDVEQIPSILDAIADSKAVLKRYMTWSLLDQTTELQLERMARIIPNYWTGADFSFHGFTKDGDFCCGTGLHGRVALNPKGFEIGYWVRTKYQGQGIATLATRMLICVGFDLLKSDRLQISHNAENEKSRRVIEKCGFVLEGTMRNLEAAKTDEQLGAGMTPCRDSVGYALTPDDQKNLVWLEEIRRYISYEYI